MATRLKRAQHSDNLFNWDLFIHAVTFVLDMIPRGERET